MASLKAEARKLIDLRKKNEAAQKVADEAKAALTEQQIRVWEMMDEEGDVSTTKDLGPGYGRWQLGKRSTIFSRVIDFDTARAALEAEGYGDEMIKSEMRKGALNELIRTRLENGEPLPDGVDFSETKYVQMTRRDKKK